MSSDVMTELHAERNLAASAAGCGVRGLGIFYYFLYCGVAHYFSSFWKAILDVSYLQN